MNSRLLLLTSFILLSSCELMRQRMEQNDDVVSQNIILTYFLSTQYPTSDENISAQLSDFFGSGVSATAESTFASWTEPPETCDYTGNFPNSAIMTRYLNLGDLVVSHGSDSVTISKSPTNFSWGFLGALSPADYQIAPQGVKGTAAFSQTFSILAASTSILAYVGNLQAASFKVPSPQIPDPSAADFNLHLSRSQPFILKISSTPGTTYLRVRLRDGSNRSSGDVTCFAKPDANVSFPPSVMSTFRTGTDGILEIDQVSVSHLKNVAHVAESVVVSATRQVHGTTEYLDANNTLQRLELGRLNIDP